jgi:hypothetical protein
LREELGVRLEELRDAVEAIQFGRCPRRHRFRFSLGVFTILLRNSARSLERDEFVTH